MEFKDFYKKFEKETLDVFKEYPKTEAVQDKIINAYAFYQNKQLVWATWFLAIATILLSILTLILK